MNPQEKTQKDLNTSITKKEYSLPSFGTSHITAKIPDYEFLRYLTNKPPIFYYHKLFGTGVFSKYSNNKEYIYIWFDKKEEDFPFIYPDAIGKYLFVNSPKNPKPNIKIIKYMNLINEIREKLYEDCLITKHRNEKRLLKIAFLETEISKKSSKPIFIYHRIFGTGIFSRFSDSKKYIHIWFENQKYDIAFIYPNSIDKYMFLSKPKNIKLIKTRIQIVNLNNALKIAKMKEMHNISLNDNIILENHDLIINESIPDISCAYKEPVDMSKNINNYLSFKTERVSYSFYGNPSNQRDLQIDDKLTELEKLTNEDTKYKKPEEQVIQRDINQSDLALEKIEKNTLLYHDVFGEGKVTGFSNNRNYIYVYFEKGNQKRTFKFPHAIETYLFIHKSKKILEQEMLLQDNEYKTDNEEEMVHFSYIKKIADKRYHDAVNKENLLSYGFNDFSDSFDSQIYKKRQSALNSVYLWRDINLNPYFARIDYSIDKNIYIGKNPIDTLVVDWRNTICNLYYQYNIYIGNPEFNLTLVRDFEIKSGVYCGFEDKFPTRKTSEELSNKNNTMSDSFLLKIIKQNRTINKTHDIIQTIQRNQYEIITYKKTENILVSGCAGSGKTMIMLHRLSYIIYNNPEIDIKSIYVISPTKLLNLESDELSSTLKVNEANRLTVASFNRQILNQYYERFSISKIISYNMTQSDYNLDPTFVKMIYSDGFIVELVKTITNTLTKQTDEYNKFIKKEEKKLLSEYMIFCQEDSTIKKISGIFDNNKSLYKNFIEIENLVAKVPISNAKEKESSLRKLLKESESKSKVIENKIKVLKHLTEHWKMSDDTIYTYSDKNDMDKISIDDTIFTDVFGYFDVLSNKNRNNKNTLKNYVHLKDRFSSTFDLIACYKILIDKSRRFDNFLNGTTKDYYSEIIDTIIHTIKHKYNIDQYTKYDFEMFLNLVVFSHLFKTLSYDNMLIYIDEFQDFASSELTLYKTIFPKATFNLFGDINQSISAKCIQNYELVNLFNNNYTRFNINENYRNARQITAMLNKEYGYKMIPIGLDGSVKYVNIPRIINLNTSDRVALIVKDLSVYDKFKQILETNRINKLNVIHNDEDKILKGYLNIIPINLTKGLEFEVVYVVNHNMTQNEFYVASTRALNKLFIINSLS